MRLRIRVLTVVAVIIAMLASAACADAAFPGRDGQLAFELTGLDLSGTQFGGAPSANGEIAAVSRGKRPRALLSCSSQVGGGCQAGASAGPPCISVVGSPCLDDSKPSFSPDGTRIVFSDDPCPQRYCRRITLINADGGSETQLPELTADDAQPAFLATGAVVFAGRATPDGAQNLYTVNVDGTGLRQLTDIGAAEPAPCTNGSIAFVHNHNLYLLGAHGRPRELAQGASWPDCSPNSQQIAFLHNRDLYLVGSSGTGLRRLTYHQVAAAAPAFSPDGQLIALNTEHDPSKQWPPSNTDRYCQGKFCTGIQMNVYLEIIDLHGLDRSKPVYLGNTGTDQDGFGWTTDAGGISWQP